MGDPLLHITTGQAWQTAEAHGAYRADSLTTEGFIHCSTAKQVAAVAEALYPGRTDLILLIIDPKRVTADIRYEDCYASGQAFPHVYGPIPLDAVVRILAYRPAPDGRFPWPFLTSGQ